MTETFRLEKWSLRLSPTINPALPSSTEHRNGYIQFRLPYKPMFCDNHSTDLSRLHLSTKKMKNSVSMWHQATISKQDLIFTNAFQSIILTFKKDTII